jgi:type VI secretion system secreted protein VgrG
MQISAQKITISGAQEITIGVGPSSITIKPDGVQISGPKVSTTAVGINEISGALIKLN